MVETSQSDQPKERRATDFFREAWSQALMKAGAAEEEASKVLHEVAELAGWKNEDARRLVAEYGERLNAQRKEIRESLDEGIHRALTRLKAPRREQLDDLWSRLSRIDERIESLRARRNSRKRDLR